MWRHHFRVGLYVSVSSLLSRGTPVDFVVNKLLSGTDCCKIAAEEEEEEEFVK